MGWWQERGGTVMMVAGLWLVMSDPIDRWLPVPMPELQPGPTTTWLEGEGVPDYVAAIDGPQAERIAAGLEIARVLVAAAGREVDGQSLAAFLDGIDIASAHGRPLDDAKAKDQGGLAVLMRGDIDWKPADPVSQAAWSGRLAAVWDELDRAPAATTLAVPTAPLVDGVVATQMRSPTMLLLMLHLGAALRVEGTTADVDLALRASVRLLRLSSWCAGIDDVPSHAAARGMRREAFAIAVRVLGAQPRSTDHRTVVAGLLASAAPLPSVDDAVRRIGRLLSLRWIIDFAQDVRAGTAKGRMAEMRINSPPDINAALRSTNGWYDALEAFVPPGTDDAALVALESASLPMPLALDQIERSRGRPLANRMIFGTPVGERREQTGAVVALGANMLCLISLVRLIDEAKASDRTERTAAILLAMDIAAPPAAWAAALRQGLGERAAVSLEGEAVVVRHPGDQGELLVRIDLGTPIP